MPCVNVNWVHSFFSLTRQDFGFITFSNFSLFLFSRRRESWKTFYSWFNWGSKENSGCCLQVFSRWVSKVCKNVAQYSCATIPVTDISFPHFQEFSKGAQRCHQAFWQATPAKTASSKNTRGRKSCRLHGTNAQTDQRENPSCTQEVHQCYRYENEMLQKLQIKSITVKWPSEYCQFFSFRPAHSRRT